MDNNAVRWIIAHSVFDQFYRSNQCMSYMNQGDISKLAIHVNSLYVLMLPIRTYLQHPHPPSIWSRFWFPCSTSQQSKQIFIIPCFRCFTLSREFVSVLQISHFTMSYLPRSGSKLLLVEYFQPILSDVSYLMYLILMYPAKLFNSPSEL